MPRYEFSEGSSNKFWEITLEGSSFTTRYGRIGTDGQETTKTFKSEAEAKHAYDKLVAEKTKKGYTLVEGGDDGDGDDDDEAAAPSGASNPELEQAILARPDDLDAYLVYGDWLQSHGDARGELIAVQAALHQSPGSTELQRSEAALIKKHGKEWLGSLAAQKALGVTWRLGFVDELTMEHNYFEEDEELEGGELLQMLLAAPAGRLLRKLHVKLWGDSDGQAHYEGIVAAIGAARPPALREIHLADFQYPDEVEMSWTELGDVSALWTLPRLEKLILQGGAMELGEIAAPSLRHFEIRTGGLGAREIESVCAASWPNLETLKLWFGDDNYGGEGTLENIEPILDGVGLSRLQHLGIMNCAFVDDVCGALARSKILPQLQTLDLSMGTMTVDGARRLHDNAKAFAHLSRIDVADNMLSDEAQALLKSLPNVQIGEQRDDDPDYRYVSVGE